MNVLSYVSAEAFYLYYIISIYNKIIQDMADSDINDTGGYFYFMEGH